MSQGQYGPQCIPDYLKPYSTALLRGARFSTQNYQKLFVARQDPLGDSQDFPSPLAKFAWDPGHRRDTNGREGERETKGKRKERKRKGMGIAVKGIRFHIGSSYFPLAKLRPTKAKDTNMLKITNTDEFQPNSHFGM